jgi:RNA polymerase sigma factor (sigma-70 family)
LGSISTLDPRLESEPWRQWLRSGTRRNRVDRRRGKGAHSRLKKVLIEGKENGNGHPPERWQGFSSSMDRHTVDEALNALPEDHRTVVKLAYFYGLTNRQIGEQLGISVGTVRTRLRQGLATASDYLERGRAATSKALYGVIFGFAAWLTGKQILNQANQSATSSDHVLQASVAVAAGAVAVGLFLANPASPAQISQFDRGAGPIVAASRVPHEVEVSLNAGGPSAVHGVVSGGLPRGVLPITTNGASGPISIVVPPVPDHVLPPAPALPKVTVPKLKKPLP